MAPKGVKRGRTSTATEEPASKRALFDAEVESRCEAVAKLVGSAKLLPAECRGMFAAMIPHCLNVKKADRHELQEKMVESLQDVFEEAEAGLRKEGADAQAVVDGAAGTAKATEEALGGAQAALDEKVKALQACTDARTESEAAVAAAAKALDEAVASREALGPELAATEEALKNTKDLMESIFAPLKDGVVTDQKCLDALAASLKPLALDQSLTDAMRVPLAKPVAERSGFDDIVVQQLEAAIAKHIEGLAGKIDQAEQLKAERGAAVASASSALEACKAAQNKIEGTEITAEEEAAHATIEWRAAKKAVKALGPQLRKAESALARSSAALGKFLEARGEFEALRDLAGPPEEEEEAAQENAAGAAAAAQAA